MQAYKQAEKVEGNLIFEGGSTFSLAFPFTGYQTALNTGDSHHAPIA
jgi:hypothetical protein